MNISIWKFLKDSAKPFKLILLGIGACVCINSASISIFHLISKYLIDALNFASKDMLKISSAYKYIILLMLSILLYESSNRLRDYFQLQMIPKLRKNVIDKLSGGTLFYPYEYFQSFAPTKFVHSMFQLSESTADIFIDYAADFLKTICSLIFSCLLLYTINTQLVYFAIIWILTWSLACCVLAKRTRSISYTLSDLKSSLSSKWTNTFDNIDSVYVYNGSSKELEKNKSYSSLVMKQDKKLQTFILKVMSVQGLVTLFITSGALFYMVSLFKVGLATTGDFILLTESIYTINMNLWEFSQDLSWLMSDLGKIRQGLDMCKTNTKKHIGNAQTINPKNWDLKLNNISFSYSDKEIFSNDDELIIPSGKKIALVGSSGSGKSTFVKLMLGLINPQQGEIFIGQNNISHMNEYELREKFALIPQDPKLFCDTVFNNIKYGSFDAIKEEVIVAAKKAQIHDFIETLPEKYDTVIQNNSLSGGQRQRLMIARGLLRNAKIFIFDESTSALDTITEKEILDAIKEIDNSRTKFIIAHRLYTIRDVDQILVFKNGRIVQTGVHDDLVKTDGLYKQLYQIQTQG